MVGRPGDRLASWASVRRRLPFILLFAVLALSFGLNARMAANPRNDYQSADERSYGKLAVGIADYHRYGTSPKQMREPLHWPPGAPVLFAVGYKLFGSEQDRKTYDIRAVYWEQALLTTGTAALAALLAWVLAGPWAGVVAGAIVGLTRYVTPHPLPRRRVRLPCKRASWRSSWSRATPTWISSRPICWPWSGMLHPAMRSAGFSGPCTRSRPDVAVSACPSSKRSRVARFFSNAIVTPSSQRSN